MKNRMSRCAALIGTVLSLSSFAQVCNDISLYKEGETGRMDMSDASFPEAPEWSTNWGEMDSMIPPYIRWSGMKDRAGDWTGSLTFSKMPVTVQGGELSFKVRATQKAKFGVWLVGEFGTSAVKFFDIEANKTYALKASVADMIGNRKALVQKVGIGLFDVPAHQYTTLFLDDVSIGCVDGNSEDGSGRLDSIAYVFSDIAPENPQREGKFVDIPTSETSASYTESERLQLKGMTNALFILDESEHDQIQASLSSTNMTPKKSRQNWYRNMYLVERNRLRDSVIANPKALFDEAESYAASKDNRGTPLLIGNVDYAYRVCSDSTCGSHQLEMSRILQVGLPIAETYSSQLELFYDPYFVSTNRSTLPMVEVYVKNRWQKVEPRTGLTLELESAGIQRIRVRLSDGNLTVEQLLFVEVK